MLRFAVRRLLLLVPILIGLSLLVFIWIRALPGSPAEALLGERATDESIAQVRDQYGLDDPFYEQYWRYLQTIGSGDFGTSIASRRPITEEITERFPATIELAIGAMLFATFIGIPLGFIAAKRSRTTGRPREPVPVADRSLHPDLLPRARPQVGVLGGARLAAERRAPGRPHRRGAPDELLRARRDHHEELGGGLGRVQHLILPAIALGLDPARDHRAHHARLRARRAERGLRADRARQGNLEPRGRHPPRAPERDAPDLDDRRPPGRACCCRARSSRRPCSRCPGIGTWLQAAIENRDYPVIQGGVLFVAIIVVLVNLLVDISYGLLNPRIRLAGR